MQEPINTVSINGHLIAQVKPCPNNISQTLSVATSMRTKNYSSNQKIKLKCVMKNPQLTEKKSPRKLIQKQQNITVQQVNFDYFLFFYINKNDQFQFKQYVKQIKASRHAYSSNFIIVRDIDEFRARFDDAKKTFCHKKFSLIVSQFGILNYRNEFKEVDEIHFFNPNQDKYSNLSFLMKDENLKSILFDLQSVDKLLQDHNVLKKQIDENQLPSYMLLEKLKRLDDENKTTSFGSTGFQFNNKKSTKKFTSKANPSQNSQFSYEEELRALRSAQINHLRAARTQNSSDKCSINFSKQSDFNDKMNKTEKSTKLTKQEAMRKRKRQSLLWFKKYSKAVSQANRENKDIKLSMMDYIIESQFTKCIENKNKQNRYSKTEDIFYKRNDNLKL